MIGLATSAELGRSIRQAFGVATIALAGIATVATSDYEVPYTRHVAVSDRAVELSEAAPEQRVRYRVGSASGQFNFDVTAVMVEAVSPVVTVAAVAGDEDRLERVDTRAVSEKPHSMQRNATLRVRCDGAIPCSIDLEVTVGAAALVSESAVGSLSVSVGDDYQTVDDELYVSVEELP